MKRENVKRHEAFDAAQTRLRLLIAALEHEPADDDLESLDFTSTAPEAKDGEDEAQPDAVQTPKND